jgi:hypothetical protein
MYIALRRAGKAALLNSGRHSLLRPSLAPLALRSYHASILPSLISTSSPEFQAKAQGMDALVQDLESKLASARQGGGAKAQERMRSKGKKLPRERYVPVVLIISFFCTLLKKKSWLCMLLFMLICMDCQSGSPTRSSFAVLGTVEFGCT